MKIWLRLAALAIGIVAILFAIDYFRHRLVRDNRQILALIPTGDQTIIYANLEQLRQAGLLGLLSNIQLAPDRQYADFVHNADFDYTRDLDAVAIAFDPAQIFIIGRGRLHWEKLKSFAESYRGICRSDNCSLPASEPGRWVSFLHIQPDVLAAAIGSNPNAVDVFRLPPHLLPSDVPTGVVWARVPHSLLAHPAGLPLPLQIYAIALQSAQSLTLHTSSATNLEVKGHFENRSTADTARAQLRLLHAGGTFSLVGSDLVWHCPIAPELLRDLN